MGLSIDKSGAFPYVQTNSIDGVGKVQFSNKQYHTNPLKPDSFDKKSVIITPYNASDRLYQKLLETVAPSALLDNYLNEKDVQRMIAQNPKIQEILERHELPLEVNVNNVKGIKDIHINSTDEYARGIAEELNLSKSDRDVISRGAIFHDYGKILIPSSLLNKADRLTPEEKRIVDLHSALGYELLKTTSMDPKTLQIVKDHHRSLDKEPDYRTQIVSVADIYSALRTKRAYKDTMSKAQAMYILNKYAEMGKINPDIINALNKYTAEPEFAAA